MFNKEALIESMEAVEKAAADVKKEVMFYDLEFLLKNDKITLHDAYMRGATINERILNHIKSLP